MFISFRRYFCRATCFKKVFVTILCVLPPPWRFGTRFQSCINVGALLPGCRTQRLAGHCKLKLPLRCSASPANAVTYATSVRLATQSPSRGNIFVIGLCIYSYAIQFGSIREADSTQKGTAGK